MLGLATDSSGAIFSTLAPNRSRNSSVSPGTATNVPDDCSPASTSAAFSIARGVSMKFVAMIRSAGMGEIMLLLSRDFTLHFPAK